MSSQVGYSLVPRDRWWHALRFALFPSSYTVGINNGGILFWCFLKERVATSGCLMSQWSSPDARIAREVMTRSVLANIIFGMLRTSRKRSVCVSGSVVYVAIFFFSWFICTVADRLSRMCVYPYFESRPLLRRDFFFYLFLRFPFVLVVLNPFNTNKCWANNPQKRFCVKCQSNLR